MDNIHHSPWLVGRHMIVRSFAIVAACFALAACNTMEGFGKDVQKTGKKIEKAAERHK